ncbi:MAG: polysaccharide deacetylase family protein [Candidatus Bathyarchaeota archaeon]
MKTKKFFVIMLILALAASSPIFMKVALSETDLGPVITLSFDDGAITQYTNAFPVMQSKGMVGTFYIISSKLSYPHMNVEQLTELIDAGNEIGSHTVSHSDFTTLTEEEIRSECLNSKATLEYELDTAVTNFAYPLGASNSYVDSIVDDYYRSGRYGGGLMDLPITAFHIHHNGWDWSLAQYKQFVDDVASTKKWGVMNFHNIGGESTSGGWITTEDFESLLDYIISKGIPVLTVNQTLDLEQTSPPQPPASTVVTTELTMNAPSNGKTGENINVDGKLTGSYNPSYTLKGSIEAAPITLSTSWGLQRTVNTDSQGNYVFNFDLPQQSGDYTLNVAFAGDENFEAEQVTEFIAVSGDVSADFEANTVVEFNSDGEMRFVFVADNPTDSEVTISEYRMTINGRVYRWNTFWREWTVSANSVSRWEWGYTSPSYYGLESGQNTASTELLTNNGVVQTPLCTFTVN